MSCYLMGLDPLDVAAEITIKMELIDVFVFSLCSCVFVVFGEAHLVLPLLQCRFGHRRLNRHQTAFTPETRGTERRIRVCVTQTEIKTKTQSKNSYNVFT